MPTDWRTAAEALLPAWLPRQRWFAGKGRPIDSVQVITASIVADDNPALLHLVAEVSQGRQSDLYSLWLGAANEPSARLEHAAVGGHADTWLYDAPHDNSLARVLLTRLAEGGECGALRFEKVAGELSTELPSLVVGAEQSNTSIIYGEEYILKLFRRVSPGMNPDLEVSRALADAGCSRIVPPLAYAEAEAGASADAEPATVALLQPYLRGATEGWALATTSVRDLYAEGDLHASEVGGDFASESERLGQATAEVHLSLANVLPTATLPAQLVKDTVRQMHHRLDAALDVAPALARFEAAIRLAFDEVARSTEAIPVQRIHGDYHLGQVMRTRDGWVLFDFEGEPARPLAERRALMSPMRDVAGMLRSFDYAARYLLADHPSAPHLAYRAGEWAERNREAFCDGYTAGGGDDPRSQAALLRAFELDKAVYEVVYETRNRPSWLPIPLGSIERLVA